MMRAAAVTEYSVAAAHFRRRAIYQHNEMPHSPCLERWSRAHFHLDERWRTLAASRCARSPSAAVVVRAQASQQPRNTATADVTTNVATEVTTEVPARPRETVVLLPGFFNDAKMYDGYGLVQSKYFGFQLVRRTLIGKMFSQDGRGTSRSWPQGGSGAHRYW